MHLTSSYRRRLLRLLFGDQHAERSQRPDRDEVEVHQAGLAHRQAMHVVLGGVDGFSVHQEHHARGVQLEPHLLDDAIEIELQSGGNPKLVSCPAKGLYSASARRWLNVYHSCKFYQLTVSHLTLTPFTLARRRPYRR